jgi:hypothetical protein
MEPVVSRAGRLMSPRKPVAMPPDDSTESTGSRLYDRYPGSRSSRERILSHLWDSQGLFQSGPKSSALPNRLSSSAILRHALQMTLRSPLRAVWAGRYPPSRRDLKRLQSHRSAVEAHSSLGLGGLAAVWVRVGGMVPLRDGCVLPKAGCGSVCIDMADPALSVGSAQLPMSLLRGPFGL